MVFDCADLSVAVAPLPPSTAGDSHASLRDDFEVTVPETDALAEILVEEGAITERTVERYHRTFPTRQAVTLVSEPGDGAAALAPDAVAIT
ncbi:hypothetical protein BH23ACT9_BH23ACT9_27750 [soil metagenome]